MDNLKTTSNKNLGMYLKSLRKQQSVSQVEMAQVLDINYRYYQDIETGKRNIRLETFLKILGYFKIRMGNLFDPHKEELCLIEEHLDEFCEKVRSENCLCEKELKAMSMFEETPFCVKVIDREGLILWCNHNSIFYHGVEATRLNNSVYIWDLSSKPAGKDHNKKYTKFLVTERPEPIPFSNEFILPNGETYNGRIYWKYLKNQSKEILGFISVLALEI